MIVKELIEALKKEDQTKQVLVNDFNGVLSDVISVADINPKYVGIDSNFTDK